MAYQTIIVQATDNQLRRGSTLTIPPGAGGVHVVVPMNQADAANTALKAQGVVLFSWDGGLTWQDTFAAGDIRRYDAQGNDRLTAQRWSWFGGIPDLKNPGQYKTPSFGCGFPVDAQGNPPNAVTGTLDTMGTGFLSGLQCDPAN